ncbi:MAG: hypothetical protein R6X25_04645 [Candidatus Krumholzibacteriia bacterium]
MDRRAQRLAIGLLVLAFCTMAGCQEQSREEVQGDQQGETSMSDRSIEQVMNDHVDDLMALDGVTGVAIGKNDAGVPCIMVLVLKLDEEMQRRLPATIEGHPVCPFESGEIRPLGDAED